MPRILPSISETVQNRPPNRRCILLVDPDPLVRGSIAHVLLSVSAAYDVITVATATDVAESAPLSKPIDLAILNAGSARVSDSHVMAEIGRLRLRFAAIPLVLFADLVNLEDLQNTLSLGVRAYFPARLGGAAALAVLRIVLAGGIFLVPTAPEPAPLGLSPDVDAALQKPSIARARGKRVESIAHPCAAMPTSTGRQQSSSAKLSLSSSRA